MPVTAADRMRRRYKPDEIRVLFIGESPPVGGTFFYYGNSNLYLATKEAFVTAIPKLRMAGEFLAAFAQMGCYLEDLSPVPVNHLNLGDSGQRRERRALRRKGIEPLARRMHPWAPTVVATVMLDMVRTGDIGETLQIAGYREVDQVDLPFPGRHRDRFVSELTGHVERWRREGILALP